MGVTRQQLAAEARKLHREDRARLAEALISSLDEAAELEQVWAREIDRRVRELRSGEIQTIPATDVLEELDRITGR